MGFINIIKPLLSTALSRSAVNEPRQHWKFFSENKFSPNKIWECQESNPGQQSPEVRTTVRCPPPFPCHTLTTLAWWIVSRSYWALRNSRLQRQRSLKRVHSLDHSHKHDLRFNDRQAKMIDVIPWKLIHNIDMEIWCVRSPYESWSANRGKMLSPRRMIL